eukprot:2025597-Prymnesium_polylepis.1
MGSEKTPPPASAFASRRLIAASAFGNGVRRGDQARGPQLLRRLTSSAGVGAARRAGMMRLASIRVARGPFCAVSR